jgi:beta-lactamase class C
MDSPKYIVLGTDRDGMILKKDSLFPVRSIAKLATSLCIHRLADAGYLSVNDPLAKYIPQSTVAVESVTVRTLLCHLSGLPNWYDETNAPWSENLTWPMVKQACFETKPEISPNTKVIYSNVGYALLAAIIEHLTNQPFQQAMRDWVFEPLAIDACYGDALPRPIAKILVPREKLENIGKPVEDINSAMSNLTGMPFGGLITNLDGTLALIHAFRGNPHGFLRVETVNEATRNQTGVLPSTLFDWSTCPWGLGPELRGTKKPHWASIRTNPESFGHAGDSGCIVWTDPSQNVTYAILATRSFDDWLFEAFPGIGTAILEIGSQGSHDATAEAIGLG